MAKAAAPKEEVKNAVAAMGMEAQLPAHLRGMQKTEKIGNVDSTDLIIPRVKLLQKISPECDQYEAAKHGRFWHSIACIDMGPELLGIPILLRKTHVLWAPRSDPRGILARASDGVHWDIPDLTFEVTPKKSPHPVKYKLGRTVNDKVDGLPALAEFGSSVPGDPNSPPAASLTYEMLWYFPEFPELSPSIILNTRSQVRPAKDLLTKVDMRPVDHFYGQYRIGVTSEKADEGEYYNYRYSMEGYASEEVAPITKALFERFKDMRFRANDETNEEEGDKTVSGAGSARGTTDANSKF